MNYSDHEDSGSAASMSDAHDSSSTIEAKGRKNPKDVGVYTYLKILNTLLYVATLFLAINYYTNSKYTSKFVYYAFFGLLVTRPILIAFYSLVVILIEGVRRSSRVSKPWKPQKNHSDSDKKRASDLSESQEASEGDESESGDNSEYRDHFYDDADLKPHYPAKQQIYQHAVGQSQ